MEKISLEFLSTGINRASKCLSHPSSTKPYLVAYASGNNIAIYDTNQVKIVRTLTGHETTVKTVCWIQSDNNDNLVEYIVSGDSNGKAIVWNTETWKGVHLNDQLSSYGAISSISGILTQNRFIILLTTSNSHIICYEYLLNEEKWNLCINHVLNGKQLPECSKIQQIVPFNDMKEQHDIFMIVIGCVDSNIHIYELALPVQDITNPIISLNELEIVKGHADWIRSIDVCSIISNDSNTKEFLLASGSQDSTIRLWKIRLKQSTSSNTFLNSSTNFDSLLYGHEDWISTVEWIIPDKNIQSSYDENSLALLSSSMDHSMIIWKPETSENGVLTWNSDSRVGEICYDGIGFFGACSLMNKGQLELLGYTFSGQLYHWKYSNEQHLFYSCLTTSGHTGPVMDITFDPTYQYIISVGLDQTTRLFAPWKHEIENVGIVNTWHEFSRPQIHGYDMTCICSLPCSNKDTIPTFISGAEEKILRVFEAPRCVLDMLSQVANISFDNISSTSTHTAYSPELSLTNKAYEDNTGNHDNGMESEQFSSPPLGNALGRFLLWPETRKLYGHGNDVLCVTRANVNPWIISACKSRETRTARLWIWDSKTWNPLQQLEGHSSSVVQIACSLDDTWIASVSKDRQICFYKQVNPSVCQYELHSRIKAHKRIIWSCDFSHDHQLLVSGSRDQTVKVWKLMDTTWKLLEQLPSFDAAVTSVAFAPCKIKGNEDQASYCIAIGLESGKIEFWVSNEIGEGWYKMMEIKEEWSHSDCIRRILWERKSVPFTELRVVSCSKDHSIRLFCVSIESMNDCS